MPSEQVLKLYHFKPSLNFFFSLYEFSETEKKGKKGIRIKGRGREKKISGGCLTAPRHALQPGRLGGVASLSTVAMYYTLPYTPRLRDTPVTKRFPEDADCILPYASAHKHVTKAKRELFAHYKVKGTMDPDKLYRKSVIVSGLKQVFPDFRAVEHDTFFSRLYEAEKKIVATLGNPPA